MIRVDIRADSRFPVDRFGLRQAVTELVARLGVKEAVVNVIIVGNRKMTSLNKKWMKREGTTDVLSFPMEESSTVSGQGGGGFVMPGEAPLYLGDVVVSYPEAVKQAAERNLMVDTQVEELVKHGVKHLLGIHHD